MNPNLSTTEERVSVNDFVFSESSQNFSQVLSSLKRSKNSIKHRLASIYEDSIFVESVADRYNLPLVANERCGGWYISPEAKFGSVYFKSTDGHHGEWSFNTRRLNLHLLDIIEGNGGCIIVDSTRRGKAMPDALSKTLPIWIAVMNAFLFPCSTVNHSVPKLAYLSPSIYSPPIPESELSQINALLPSFLSSLQLLKLPQSKLQSKLSKPLLPIFITQSTYPLPTVENLISHNLPEKVYNSCYPVILLTASRAEPGHVSDRYIQGAGDDMETWACGLTPGAFWGNRELLMVDVEDEELKQRIREGIVHSGAVSSRSGSMWEQIRVGERNEPAFCIGIEGGSMDSDLKEFDAVVVCSRGGHIGRDGSNNRTASEKLEQPMVLRLECRAGKIGSRGLREKLPLLIELVDKVCQKTPQPKLLFLCNTGKDLSVGVALVMSCLYYDDKGSFNSKPRADCIDKKFIRQRLVEVLDQLPGANPARATLQSVNSFLMTGLDQKLVVW